LGPEVGEVSWETSIDSASFYSGVSIGLDSTIYVVSHGGTSNSKIYGFSKSGEVIIELSLPPVYENLTTPLIRNDNTIIAAAEDVIIAFDENGNELWKYDFNSEMNNESIAIDKDGYIYFTTIDKELIVLSPKGNLSWKLSIDELHFGPNSYQLSFSPDGNTLYIPGYSATVIAVDISERTVKWKYGEKANEHNILVDSDGNIYFGRYVSKSSKRFTSLKSNGTLRWEMNFLYKSGWSDSPAIDKNGNLYFGTDSLHSTDYEGNFRWSRKLDGVIGAGILCDNNNNIFVITIDPIKLYCFSDEGSLKWSLTDDDSYFIYGSPAITQSKNIIYATPQGKVSAIN
jgi:outer membrane protein assembly factor BamB